jgi:hypothetical protein
MTISPVAPTIIEGDSVTFTATVAGVSNPAVTWSASGGSITSAGVYTCSTLGTYTIVATSVANPANSITTTVNVTHANPH